MNGYKRMGLSLNKARLTSLTMPEEVKKEEVKEEKKKGPLGKLKEKVEDSEEHLAILSTFVRLGILVWSGGILTLNYVTIPQSSSTED